MNQQAQTVFYLERLQPAWLPTPRLHRQYALVFGLGLGLGAVLVYGLGVGLVFGLVIGLGCGLIGLGGGLGGREVEAKLTPNQGIRRSARSALLVGLAAGLVVGLVFGLMFGLRLGPGVGLVYGLGGGLVIGLSTGLIFGGAACISHTVLRLVLWRSGAPPRDTVRFLDYATERIFLRRVGGGYIFVHRLLQEYFATLEAETSDRATVNHAAQRSARSPTPP